MNERFFAIALLIGGIIGFASGFSIAIGQIEDFGMGILTAYCEGEPVQCDSVCKELYCRQEFGCITSAAQDYNVGWYD
jgi:hypothetical protein